MNRKLNAMVRVRLLNICNLLCATYFFVVHPFDVAFTPPIR